MYNESRKEREKKFWDKSTTFVYESRGRRRGGTEKIRNQSEREKRVVKSSIVAVQDKRNIVAIGLDHYKLERKRVEDVGVVAGLEVRKVFRNHSDSQATRSLVEYSFLLHCPFRYQVETRQSWSSSERVSLEVEDPKKLKLLRLSSFPRQLELAI